MKFFQVINTAKNLQAGFTLIEVMVALMLYGIISAGMMPVFSDLLKHNTESALKTQAMAAAQQKLDELRVENPQDMPNSGTSAAEIVNIDGREFSVYTTYCSIASFCSSINNRHIHVEAHYNGSMRFEVDTVFTTLR